VKKLVGYITSSLPNSNFTVDLSLSMKDAGVDILELGVPFSDPVADGEIIEKASLQSIKNGFKLEQLFDISSKISPHLDIFWMGYMNTFYHYGMEKFIQKADDLSVKGFIIPDLPYEESKAYSDVLSRHDKAIIDFVAPTDDFERIKLITKKAKEFIYLVAYTGITGQGQEEDLSKLIDNIRQCSSTPVYIGFGVNELNAKQKSQNLDGVIVGSVFVKHLVDDSLNFNEKISKITTLARQIKEKINS
jgi:tryptophan synthase alpha chain